MAEKKERYVEQVTVYSYPPIVFFWPVIMSGFVLSVLTAIHPSPAVYGVLWWITLIVPISTTGIDVSRDNLVKLVFASVAIGFGCWLLAAYGVSFQWLGDLIRNTVPAFNVGIALWTSIVGSTLLLLAIFISRFESHWIINSNQFQHNRWLAVDRSISHGSKTVMVEYPDMQEFLLLFAGDIVIKTSDGSRELARITNVPLLPWSWPYIRELVEEVRVRKNRRAPEEDELDADGEEL